MKTNVIQSPTITSENMQGSQMGMSTKGIDIASYFLRDKIYSDKILAVIREYICNALDETVKYQIQKPVEVKIESIDGQYIWSVRDHAKGLSEHGIRNIFGMYFESTKSNDNNSIGGFGIGSKSAMSYTDTFYITSHFEGVCTKYCATLGGGQTGVPIGQIYKISEEPTTESGIEISLDVTRDSVTFHEKTWRFVQNLPTTCNIVYTDKIGTVSGPALPKFQENLGDYSISLYEHPSVSYQYTSRVAIRMGGVIYDYKPFVMDVSSPNGYIVIDVPIGKLSIPISRESLEDTPANSKILNDIQKELDSFITKDKTKLQTPNFKDYISSASAQEVSTDWFTYSLRQYFPQTHVFAGSVNKSKWVDIPDTNGKMVVYLFPDIKNNSNWKERLVNGLTLIDPNFNGGYYWLTSTPKYLDMTTWNETIDLTDVVFVDVKKMKLPKLEKNGPQTQYQVFRNHYKQGSYTAEEYEDHIAEKYKVDLADKWWENATTYDELNLRTIALVSEWGTSNTFSTAYSKKMVEGLVEIGWLTPDSAEWKAKHAEITENNRIEKLRSNAQYYVKDTIFGCEETNKLVVRAVSKNDTKLSRLRKVKNKIQGEQSLRGKILRNINTYAYLTRSDLRTILKLK
jgi:anti-sigma regulatory factor (Ser/Thr protein kinase)